MKTKIIAAIIALTVGVTSLSAHSKAIKPEFVDMLLPPYFALQGALSGDSLADAKTSAATFQTMLGHGPSFEEAPSLLELQDYTKTIAIASDIRAARSAFLSLSDYLTEMIEHVGTSGVQDVYQMNCPMAFEDRGGAWLQNSKDLTNPYYGSVMYKCGIVQNQLVKSKAKDSHDHSGHGDQDHSTHNH